MRHFYQQMSPQRRQSILDEARQNGRMGIERLPDRAHLEEISDSLIIKALDANALGLLERRLGDGRMIQDSEHHDADCQCTPCKKFFWELFITHDWRKIMEADFDAEDADV